MITLTALTWVPPFAQGLVRDLRARWALEEANLPHRVRLLESADQASAEYRRLQPFGQVPALRDGDIELFESGAIVLHVGARSEALLPADPAGHARAVTWVLAALNTVEVPIQQLAAIDLFHSEKEWARLRRPEVEASVRNRLADLSAWLGDRDYLEDRFTAGDLMMASVLRILRHTDMIDQTPNLAAYRARCEARPAFQKALADQMAAFSAAEAERQRRGAA